MNKRVEIFEADRLLLAKGLFRVAQELVEDSFDWKRVMQFRSVLITGGQMVELTTFRLSILERALNLLERKGRTTRTIVLRKKLNLA